MERDTYNQMADTYSEMYLDEQGGKRGAFRKSFKNAGNRIPQGTGAGGARRITGRVSPSKQNMLNKPKPTATSTPTPRPSAPTPAASRPTPRPSAPTPAASRPTPRPVAKPAPTASSSVGTTKPMTGSKSTSPFKSSRLNNALTGIKAGAWKNRTESMDETQRSRNMADAYRQMYETKGYQEGGEVGKDDDKKGGSFAFRRAIIPGQMIQRKTEINVEVNPQKEKIGDVEKAYYTYPAGFDPTNREDITRKGTTNESVEVDVTDEEFYNYMVEEGLCESTQSAEAMLDHMSDDWFASLYEEAKKKKGRCWTGYKPTPGKEAYSPGSCEKA